jgi:hypothetical protein
MLGMAHRRPRPPIDGSKPHARHQPAHALAAGRIAVAAKMLRQLTGGRVRTGVVPIAGRRDTCAKAVVGVAGTCDVGLGPLVPLLKRVRSQWAPRQLGQAFVRWGEHERRLAEQRAAAALDELSPACATRDCANPAPRSNASAAGAR